MEKKNKIILGIIIIITLVVIFGCIYSVKNHQQIITSDAIKFKEEYESINGMVNEKNNKNYPNVNISSENPIIYKTDEEILDILNNESAIVYFGFEKCPWCRSMIETLLKSAHDNDIKTIYYVNILNIRDSYSLDENNKIVTTTNGTEAYKKILKFFGNKLSRYYLFDEENNQYDTKTTRLYAPTVVAVKGGKILGIHEVTVESQIDPYVSLNETQKEELYKIFYDLEKLLEDNTCEANKSC